MSTPLPRPDGVDNNGTPWWRLCDGRRVYAGDGHVLDPDTSRWTHALDVERDGLALVAAARTALHKTQTHTGTRPA